MSTTIQTLPSELLLLIFKHTEALQDIQYDELLLDELLKPTTFPYSLANVCRLWKTLITCVPRYLKCPIVFIDSDISQGYLERLFKGSRTLLFSLYVLRRVPGGLRRDFREKRRVTNVIKALVPHAKRCRYARFDLHHPMSLTNVPAIFHASKTLDKLEINTKLITTVWTPAVQLSPFKPRLTFHYPVLEGCTLADAVFDSRWLKHFLDEKRRFADIAHIKPGTDPHTDTPDLPTFLTHLRALCYLIELTIDDVDLPYDTRPGVVHSHIDIAVRRLTMCNLTGVFVHGFFALGNNKVAMTELTLDACGLPLNPPPLRSCVLILRNLPHPEDVLRLLRAWDGFELYVMQCAGTDDALVRLLSEVDAYDGRFVAGALRTLVVRPSLGITSAEVRRMAFHREARARRWVPGWGKGDGVPLPMRAITMAGMGREAGGEDLRWLKGHVLAVSWQASGLEEVRCEVDVEMASSQAAQEPEPDFDFSFDIADLPLDEVPEF